MILVLLMIGGTALVAVLKPEVQPEPEPVAGRRDPDSSA